jgi:diguanylate cyclase (GGDEF)-like protein
MKSTRRWRSLHRRLGVRLATTTQQSAAILHVAERIRTSIAATPMPTGDLKIAITVSGGCAAGSDNSPDDLVKVADIRLYEAKAAGRNRIVAAPGVR